MDDRTRPSPPADGATAYAETSPFQAAKPEPLLNRAIPVSAELPRYRAPSARRDVVAGVTVAALAVPAAMAYAEVAGVSPVNGLYALLLPTVAYVLLGSSRQLIVGPEGSVSTLVGAAVLPLAASASDSAAELAAMLALLVAACFALAWVLRLGWIADYFSRPVLLGYIHGVAVVLIIGQLGKLAGLSIDARDPLSQLWEVLHDLNNISGTTVVLAATALAALFALRALHAEGARGARSRCGRDRALVGIRPAGTRRGGRRRDSCRATELRRATPCLAGRHPALAGGGRRLPRLVRRRDPDRPFVRGEAQPACARPAGAARDGNRERRRRFHAGLLDRRKRLTDGRERQHGRTQPGRRPRRGRRGARDRRLPDRARAVPAQGGPRGGDRVRRDRPVRAHGLACSGGGRPCRGLDRRRDNRLRHRARRARGAHRGCRAVDDRHGAQKRQPARRGARLGGAARTLRGRLATPDARA